ncbi:MAG: PIN domain-containing protein [Bacteroidota bacterium]
MKIVVDTNIVFSAMLNTKSKISYILLKPSKDIKFYSTQALHSELLEHSNKIMKISGYSVTEFNNILSLFLNKIRIINPEFIPKNIYLNTFELTHDVDIDDTEFVALTDHIDGLLWSGDKELKKGLELKGWKKFVSTAALFDKIKTS